MAFNDDKEAIQLELKNDCLSVDDRAHLEETIQKINESIANIQFSQEMIPREIYQFSQRGSEKAQKNQRKEFHSYSRQQVTNGQPIELIDGDNL
mmetsp:Transcript_38909/g.59125  ORF Transcript_38909/g.59125 Transcript_38909/m.59125 type:complete len:94 (+) Transcript_38909:2979-3260(+)